MIKNKFDKVSFITALLGIASLLFSSFLIFRPNRIASGTEIFLLNEVPVIMIVSIFALWLFIFISSFIKNKSFKFISGLASLIILFLIFISAVIIAKAELSDAETYARISFGSAFWLSVFFVFVILLNVFSHLKEGILLRLILGGIGVSGILILIFSGILNDFSIMKEFINKQDRFLRELFTHFQISFTAVFFSTIIGVPLGIFLYKKKLLEKLMFPVLNLTQTIPNLALFGILMALLSSLGFKGIGWTPAVIALTIYAILPIVRNTYTAFKTIESGVIEAGIGMGMNKLQLLYKVQLPISLPIILNGIRISLVLTIGNTAVATLIGAGGLGKFIFQGLESTVEDLILLGALPIVIIAVIIDFLMQFLISIITPKGLE